MKEKTDGMKNGGKYKIILGSLSLLTIFATPYLNITQISLNLNLLQSAAYSFILLGFWIVAGSILREKHAEREPLHIGHRHIHRHKPVASV